MGRRSHFTPSQRSEMRRAYYRPSADKRELRDRLAAMAAKYGVSQRVILHAIVNEADMPKDWNPFDYPGGPR